MTLGLFCGCVICRPYEILTLQQMQDDSLETFESINIISSEALLVYHSGLSALQFE